MKKRKIVIKLEQLERGYNVTAKMTPKVKEKNITKLADNDDFESAVFEMASQKLFNKVADMLDEMEVNEKKCDCPVCQMKSSGDSVEGAIEAAANDIVDQILAASKAG